MKIKYIFFVVNFKLEFHLKFSIRKTTQNIHILKSIPVLPLYSNLNTSNLSQNLEIFFFHSNLKQNWVQIYVPKKNETEKNIPQKNETEFKIVHLKKNLIFL